VTTNSSGVTVGSSASVNLGGAPRSLDTLLASHARVRAAIRSRAHAISGDNTRNLRPWRMAYPIFYRMPFAHARVVPPKPGPQQMGFAQRLQRCRQVAMTLLESAEPDGTGWKRTGFSFASHSKEMSAKVAFRKGFLL